MIINNLPIDLWVSMFAIEKLLRFRYVKCTEVSDISTGAMMPFEE